LIGILAGLPVFGLALRTHWRSSLGHALLWATAAWIAWGVAFALDDGTAAGMEPSRFCALGLTGCAGVAVLGARRPYVFAWNFVVLGLFGVMILPLLETLLIGTHPVDALRIAFLAGTIAVGALNYLPTRLGPAALMLLAACTGQFARLFGLPTFGDGVLFDALLVSVPWLAWLGTWRRARASDFDRLWLGFRDAWGLVWSQRVREQFNRAAENAGLHSRLRWRGLVGEEVESKKCLEMLQSILQRFIAPPAP
jgi:hypothetical protein